MGLGVRVAYCLQVDRTRFVERVLGMDRIDCEDRREEEVWLGVAEGCRLVGILKVGKGVRSGSFAWVEAAVEEQLLSTVGGGLG